MKILSENEKKAIALSALKGDRPLLVVAKEFDVMLWQVIECALLMRQGSEQVSNVATSDNDGINQTAKLSSVEKTVFIHIEKTGGTTLDSHLSDFFAVADICPAGFHHQLEDLALAENLSKYAYLSGHFYYSWFKQYSGFGKKTKYLTMLRDPVKRHISWYLHWMREPVRIHRHISPLNEGWNQQCLKLSPLNTRINQPSLHEHLAAAKEALDSFFFVGIHERFDESMEILFDVMGGKVPSAIRRQNVAQRNVVQFSKELLDDLAELNWADVELYGYAKHIFEARLQSQKQRKVRDYIFPEFLPVEVNYRVQDKLSGDNWHSREGLGTPRPWRWSGPGENATLEFPIAIKECSQYRVSVQILNAMGTEALNSFRMFLNDIQLELVKRRDEHNLLFFDSTVSGKIIIRDLPLLIVRMVVDKTKSHREVNPLVYDDRRCGVAITEFNFNEIPNNFSWK